MRLRGCVFVLTAALFAVVAGPAHAAPFANNSGIALNGGDCDTATQAPATPYGSQIPVAGLTGNITDVNVTLRDITTNYATDLRVLLVGPTGAKTLVMHEIPSDNDTVGQTWTFDDEAAGPPPTYSAATGSYKPAQVDDDDYGCDTVSASDSLPAPAPAAPYGGALSAFDGTAANGTWTLYVASEDDNTEDLVEVIEGWCLEIATAANAAQPCTTPGGISRNDSLDCEDPGDPAQQPGDPYPSVRATSGLSGQVTDVNLTLKRYSHSYPSDTLMLLVGPGGQKVLVMNYDGGGDAADDATFTLDDEAGSSIPSPIVNGTYLPAASGDPGEFCDGTTSFVAPAPPGPYSAGLSSFDGSSPNGDWKLYLVDAVSADYGDIEGWCVQVTTTVNAAVNFCTPPGVLGPYPTGVLADTPAGYWRFGEPSGTTAVDSSPNHNDGTYLNGPILGVPGALVADANTAASFDGVNDSVRVPDANSLDVGDSFTLEGWVKRSLSTKSHELFNKGGNGLQLSWMNAANGSQIWLRKANVTTIARTAVAVPSDGLFHHIVATKNGPGVAAIYVDGVASTVVLSTTQVIANTAFPLTFTGPATSQHVLDEFALYDGVLSPAQVTAHYLAGIGGGAG